MSDPPGSSPRWIETCQMSRAGIIEPGPEVLALHHLTTVSVEHESDLVDEGAELEWSFRSGLLVVLPEANVVGPCPDEDEHLATLEG